MNNKTATKKRGLKQLAQSFDVSTEFASVCMNGGDTELAKAMRMVAFRLGHITTL